AQLVRVVTRGESDAYELALDRTQSLCQILRVESECHIVATRKVRVDRLGCSSLLAAGSIHRDARRREGETQGSGTIQHEGHTTYCLDQIGGVDNRIVLGLLGEESAHRREIALDQQRRHGLVARGEGDDLAVALSGERDLAGAAVTERLSDLGQRPGRDQRGLLSSLAIPRNVAQRDAVAVGRDKTQILPCDL